MAVSHCPGQDRRYWTPDDIVFVDCPACGMEVELFKDEGSRRCPGCGVRVQNPKVLEGCAAWCSFAEDCIGFSGSGEDPARKAITALKGMYDFSREDTVFLFRIYDTADGVPSRQVEDPLGMKTAAVVFGALYLLGKEGTLPFSRVAADMTEVVNNALPAGQDAGKIVEGGRSLYEATRKASETTEEIVNSIIGKAARMGGKKK